MRTSALALSLALTACAPTGVSTTNVTADGETVAVKSSDDAADDPAIWRNAADPAASLIIGTDKQAGLYVYGLNGRVRHFLDAGRVNNVDLAETPADVIVAASDRNDEASAHIALFRLDPARARLEPLGRVPAGSGEAYGLCLWATPSTLTAFIVIKDGTIRQIEIDTATAAGRVVRTLKLATQSEGCVVDQRTARLYVAEEDIGIWRFDARANGDPRPTRVASADNRHVFADIEGLAVAAEGDGNGGYLVASSQGDNAYAVWRLSDERYVGRFRIAAGRVGATEETDGIAVMTGSFGTGFPNGLLVVQDGNNVPAQNFKLVSWQSAKRAMKLP